MGVELQIDTLFVEEILQVVQVTVGQACPHLQNKTSDCRADPRAPAKQVTIEQTRAHLQNK